MYTDDGYLLDYDKLAKIDPSTFINHLHSSVNQSESAQKINIISNREVRIKAPKEFHYDEPPIYKKQKLINTEPKNIAITCIPSSREINENVSNKIPKVLKSSFRKKSLDLMGENEKNTSSLFIYDNKNEYISTINQVKKESITGDKDEIDCLSVSTKDLSVNSEQSENIYVNKLLRESHEVLSKQRNEKDGMIFDKNLKKYGLNIKKPLYLPKSESLTILQYKYKGLPNFFMPPSQNIMKVNKIFYFDPLTHS